MPARSRRTVTYNLTSASARSAFEHGLDFHDDISDSEDSSALMGTSPGTASSLGRSQQRRSSQPFAHGSAPSHNSYHSRGPLMNGQGTERQTIDLINLFELFPAADRSLVEEVYAGCDFIFDEALDSLSELLSGKGSESLAAPSMPDGHESTEAHAGFGSWSELPEEVKEIILGMLPVRDVAKAAATSWEFARRVKLGAVNASVLTIPLGLSLSGIIGMVSGHPNAHTVSLTRWGKQVLQDRDFGALLSAISSGSRSSRRNTPVESISLKGWSSLKDGNVMTLCSTMQHLKEVDLTDCTGITDAALVELSKYQRLPPQPPRPVATGTATLGGRNHVGASGNQHGQHRSSDDEDGNADEEDLLFDMESSGPTRAEARRTREHAWDAEDEEDVQRATMESLALLASSPPMPRAGLSAESPPSSLMAPGHALGSRMAGLRLGVDKSGAGRRGGAAGSSGGWVGSWDRGAAAATAAAAAAPADVSGTSPPSAAGLPGRLRLSTAAGPGLRSLVLAGCSQVSAEGVRTLLASAGAKASLEALDVSRCQRMTRQALLVPPASCLRILKCAGCNNLHEVILQLPHTCPLTELHLNNCKQLSKLLIVAPNLKLLHVGGCKGMVAMSLRCPQLTQLLANLCFRLLRLHLLQVERSDAGAVDVPRLQHLNLFGARHLETASLAAILQQSPCLSTLNLNGCNTVSSLDISPDHADLSTLDVSACKGLVSIRVASPGLKDVRAKTCPRLQEVMLDSRQLQLLDVSHCSQLQRLHLAALQGQQQQAAAVLGQQLGGGAAAAAAAAVAAGVVVPRLITQYAERLLQPETLQQVRAVKAARRAAAAEAAAASVAGASA